MTHIRRLTTAALAATMTISAGVFSAGPAAASDMTLQETDATMLTEHAVGQPYWMLQAQCAGLFGATANYRMDQSKSGRAQKLAAADVGQGTQFLNDAVARIRADRGLDYDTAMSTLVPVVQLGRAKAQDALNTGSTDKKSKWNLERSFCLDVADAYRAHRG